MIKIDGRSLRKLWLFRKRKASHRHPNVDTPLKKIWADKILSLTLCDGECPPFVLILAIFPFSLNPSLFPPLPSARQQFIYIIVYAGSFLPPRWTHTDFSCCCFPFSQVFPRCYKIQRSSASPLSPQNTPFLGFFGVFPSHAHIYFTDSVFPPPSSYLLAMLSLSSLTRTGFRHFIPAALPGAAAVGRRSRSFSVISSCF